jgi:hypothetical protein
VDKAIPDGLGLRWFFMGPFETIDLNRQHGIAEYCKNPGPMYHGLAREQADPLEWTPMLVAAVESQRRLRTPADNLPSRRSWRDRGLAALVGRTLGQPVRSMIGTRHRTGTPALSRHERRSGNSDDFHAGGARLHPA